MKSKTTSKSASNGKLKQSNGNASEKKTSADQKLRELFETELKDIYWAEKALTKALPKMIKKASDDDLIDSLKSHLEETKEQVVRLEKVFESIGKKAVAKKCEAMEGLIAEAEEIMSEQDDDSVRDQGIIAAAQKVEHYEIATYGTLCAFAKTLGEEKALSFLQETLEEEKAADEKLTEIAESLQMDLEEEEEENDSDIAVAPKRKIK
jgi:ferritin-like metal-binding protein YciE